MQDAANSTRPPASVSQRFARRLLTIGENRLQLLTVEVQEEREHLLHAILLALGVAAFGLLAGVAATAAVVFLLSAFSPVLVLAVLAGLYGIAGVCLCWRLGALLRGWRTLPASVDQFRKDITCLEQTLG
jgi:uncharacterized membrane protein YqjE